MTNEQCGMSAQHEHSEICFKKRVSWTAIIVGALIGIGLAFLLDLFSVAIGLSFVTTSKEGMMTLAIGGLVGLLIGTIASMFVAGFASGYLGRAYCIKRNLGVLYGFTTWCLALILTALLATNLTRYVSFYSDFVSNPTMVVSIEDKHMEMNTSKLSTTTKPSTTTNSSSTAMMSSQTQKVANTLGISSFIIFVLFFVGALSSCFGGHCGMTCCSKDNCSTK